MSISDSDIFNRLIIGDKAGAQKLMRKQAAYQMKHVERKTTPRCYACPHRVDNFTLERQTVFGKIDGKRRRRRIMPGDSWCVNGDMFRINGNHRRWWGFDRRCPLNPYTHTCLVCGKRMCTTLKMCKSCAKSREYL